MFVVISSAEMSLCGEIYGQGWTKSSRIQSIAGERGKD
jgi:hypothetical protein